MALSIPAAFGLATLLTAGAAVALKLVAPDGWESESSSLQMPLIVSDGNQNATERSAPSVLLLGPSGSGKSTLFRIALRLSGEQQLSTTVAPAPTKGLVRRLLLLPAGTTPDGTKKRAGHVLLCDAGGARQERRMWVELVRDKANEVSALVFVADASDLSEDTLELFRQLVGSKWAQSAACFLALTKLDCIAKGDELAVTEAAYRSIYGKLFAPSSGVADPGENQQGVSAVRVLTVCTLDCLHDEMAACEFLADVVCGALTVHQAHRNRVSCTEIIS